MDDLNLIKLDRSEAAKSPGLNGFCIRKLSGAVLAREITVASAMTSMAVASTMMSMVGEMTWGSILLPVRQSDDDVVFLSGQEHHMCKLRLSQLLLFVSVIDVRCHPI